MDGHEPFDRGGYIAGPPVQVTIGIDECIMRADDVHAGRAVCWRADVEHLAAIGKDGVPHDVNITLKPADEMLAALRKRAGSGCGTGEPTRKGPAPS